MTRALRWAAEIAGVIALAVAASLWSLPLGIVVVGVYLVVIAQLGEDDGITKRSS